MLRFTGSGVGAGASLFTLPDFLRPSPVMIVVGPSAANDFHGGDMARDAERCGVDSSSLRRFEGRGVTPSSSPMSALESPSTSTEIVLLSWVAASLRVMAESLVVSSS